jgi:uncharacterized protein (TIGR02757 family)
MIPNLDLNKTRDILESLYDLYNTKDFIAEDPISIPHRFEIKQDIELAGFFSATIAWGKRKMIVDNANRMMALFDNSPYDFIKNHSASDLMPLLKFRHRTFGGEDLLCFVESLKSIFIEYEDLESAFCLGLDKNSAAYDAITLFRSRFLRTEGCERAGRHVSNPLKNSAAKRLNMFLRWMVRKDNQGVDFGIWNSLKPNALICPLDIHSGRTARMLGLLVRKQDDRKAAEELTRALLLIDPEDPVRFDYALFGFGVHEKGISR